MSTKEDEIAKAQDLIKVGSQRLKELGVDGDARSDISTKLEDENQGASLFERMTSAELMELYQIDRPKWQQVIDAHQSAGERKLAKLQGR